MFSQIVRGVVMGGLQHVSSGPSGYADAAVVVVGSVRRVIDTGVRPTGAEKPPLKCTNTRQVTQRTRTHDERRQYLAPVGNHLLRLPTPTLS